MLIAAITAALWTASTGALPRTPSIDPELCPTELRTRQELDQPAGSWERRTSGGRHILQTVIFYEGHPSKMASLVYDDGRKEKGKEVLVWHLPKETEHWIECSYSFTTVALARPLPAGTGVCEVAYEQGYRAVSALRCR